MLEIDPQTVYFLILKAREFDDKDEPGDTDPDDSPADVAMHHDMHYFDDDPVAQDLKDTIDGFERRPSGRTGRADLARAG